MQRCRDGGAGGACRWARPIEFLIRTSSCGRDLKGPIAAVLEVALQRLRRSTGCESLDRWFSLVVAGVAAHPGA